jgi:hypothetical protein
VIEARKIVARVLPLERTRYALEAGAAEHDRGKTVLTVRRDPVP